MIKLGMSTRKFDGAPDKPERMHHFYLTEKIESGKKHELSYQCQYPRYVPLSHHAHDTDKVPMACKGKEG